MGKRVPRTRNAGTWTESQFWTHLRSSLRRAYRYWKPIGEAKRAARRPYKGRGRQKWEYRCNHCKQWFADKEVQVDHIVPCGQLRCFEDLPGFVQRLTTEDGYQVLCKPCHKIKTDEEKKQRA